MSTKPYRDLELYGAEDIQKWLFSNDLIGFVYDTVDGFIEVHASPLMYMYGDGETTTVQQSEESKPIRPKAVRVRRDD